MYCGRVTSKKISHPSGAQETNLNFLWPYRSYKYFLDELQVLVFEHVQDRDAVQEILGCAHQCQPCVPEIHKEVINGWFLLQENFNFATNRIIKNISNKGIFGKSYRFVYLHAKIINIVRDFEEKRRMNKRTSRCMAQSKINIPEVSESKKLTPD